MFSDPVVGENFFGRQEIVDLIVKRADSLKAGYRQNVAIIGHQQLGKTSLLRHFLHLYKDPGILAIYVEIKFPSLDYFVDQFVRSLLFRYLSASGEEHCGGAETMPSMELEGLAARASAGIPQTVSHIREIVELLRHRKAEEAYSRLFGLTSVVREETGKNCIVILDEFHKLGELGIKNAFSDFGKKIMIQKDTLYLVSSSSFAASQKILAEKLTLLFGNFERIYLEPFDFETAFLFLQKKLAPAGVPENLRNFLTAFTDGHPFFLDVIAGKLRELVLLRNERELSGESVAEAFARLFFDAQGVLHQFFMKLLSPWAGSREGRDMILLLTELAKGRNKLKDLCRVLNRSRREVSKKLEELVEREMILKTGVFYRFHNRIFKFWLKEVYEPKELTLLASLTSGDFSLRVKGMIAEEESLMKVDAVDRVSKLFCEFRNDIIDLGEKRRLLPHFTEVTAGDGGAVPSGGSKRILAKGNGRCWICKVVEEKATEREVMDLTAGEGQSKRRFSTTKVLVALKGLEDTAKLLAKERKVLTLGLSKINMLMELYGKAPIVRLGRQAKGP
ncbi:MAG: ATP-binding protein [Candidatus Omnitrophica bacterium]|nr:ATP-binding protein [Candidatus Omnitrophota bacterium]